MAYLAFEAVQQVFDYWVSFLSDVLWQNSKKSEFFVKKNFQNPKFRFQKNFKSLFLVSNTILAEKKPEKGDEGGIETDSWGAQGHSDKVSRILIEPICADFGFFVF